MIKIVPPKAESASQMVSGAATRVYNGDGGEMKGVVSADIHLSCDSAITATVTVCAQLEEVWAYPFMSEKSFLDAAEHYGYDVKKRG